jgi:polysaccharide pyruvyl transferase WcaK-like protein
MPHKVGIITYHNTINYGAILQTYALSHFLEINGYEVEVIDYRPASISREEKKYLYLSKHVILNPLGGIKRKWKMNNFLKKQIKLSPNKFYTIDDLTNYKHQYDFIICGSDEIWNINLRGLDRSYFIGFINNPDITKISYAASFGSTQYLNNYQQELSKLFKQFHTISVRDDNSLALINQCECQARKVLDPTLLVSYEDIISYPKVKSKYLLVYGTVNQREAEFIKVLAAKKGLDIISIGSNNLTKFQKKDLFDVSPQQWLGFFSEASFIVTKFYHGVIFSLIFDKPFLVFEQQSKSVKINDLLRMLNLQERIVNLELTENLKTSDTDHLLSYTMTDFARHELRRQIADSQDYLLHTALK